MKGKKYGIIVSIIILIISSLSLFVFTKCENCLGENISLGILSSSFVTLIISISDYLVEKRNTLEYYYDEISEILVAFNKIKYVDINEKVFRSAKYITQINFRQSLAITDDEPLKELMKYYEELNFWSENDNAFSENKKEEIILTEVEKDCEQINLAMNSYLEMEGIRYSNVEKAYGRIDFLFDLSKIFPNSKKNYRSWIYYNLHKKIRDMVDIIESENYHFKLYKEKRADNLNIVVEKIQKLNEKLFEKEIETNGNYETINVYPKFLVEEINRLEHFRSRIYKCKEEKEEKYVIYSTKRKCKSNKKNCLPNENE